MKTLNEVVVAEMQNSIDQVRFNVSKGTCNDMGEYKELCGFIRGLESAQALIKDLAKRHDDDE